MPYSNRGHSSKRRFLQFDGLFIRVHPLLHFICETVELRSSQLMVSNLSEAAKGIDFWKATWKLFNSRVREEATTKRRKWTEWKYSKWTCWTATSSTWACAISWQFAPPRSFLLPLCANTMLWTQLSTNHKNSKEIFNQTHSRSCCWHQHCHGFISTVDDSKCQKFPHTLLQPRIHKSNWETS